MIQALLLTLCALAAPRAFAAESVDNCETMIASLPALISTPGHYCLDADIAVAMESGSAITIESDDVAIDCLGHAIDNGAASAATTATGLAANERRFLTVRRCRIEGFAQGLTFTGQFGGDLLLEDNVFAKSRTTAIQVQGHGSMVRRNRVLETGGSTVAAGTVAIATIGNIDVLDNTIDGMTSNQGGPVNGIQSSGCFACTIGGNRVRNLAGGSSLAGIISSENGKLVIRGNDVVGNPALAGGYGIRCSHIHGRVADNTISGWAEGIYNCGLGPMNVVRP